MENDQNRIAIVTGGGSGIGLAIADKFIQNNITTIIVGRDELKLTAAKKKFGNLCFPIFFDLNNLSSIPKLAEQIIAQYKKIDILVNNAGINLKREFTEVTDEDFQKIMQTM